MKIFYASQIVDNDNIRQYDLNEQNVATRYRVTLNEGFKSMAAKKRPKAGRPKKADAKRGTIHVRFNEELKSRAEEAAKSEHRTLTNWLEKLVIDELERIEGDANPGG